MKRLIWTLSVILFAVAVAAVYIFIPGLVDMVSEKESDLNQTLDQIRQTTSGTVTAKEMKVFAEEGKNPFGQSVALENLNDEDYREYIHGMSHQKVKADKKWGFYEINDERIEWLLDGLKMAESDSNLSTPDIYKDILERWKNNEFSAVDRDHNVIWDLQNGTVGRATGILSTEEEKAYIESKQ